MVLLLHSTSILLFLFFFILFRRCPLILFSRFSCPGDDLAQTALRNKSKIKKDHSVFAFLNKPVPFYQLAQRLKLVQLLIQHIMTGCFWAPTDGSSSWLRDYLPELVACCPSLNIVATSSARLRLLRKRLYFQLRKSVSGVLQFPCLWAVACSLLKIAFTLHRLA